MIHSRPLFDREPGASFGAQLFYGPVDADVATTGGGTNLGFDGLGIKNSTMVEFQGTYRFEHGDLYLKTRHGRLSGQRVLDEDVELGGVLRGAGTAVEVDYTLDWVRLGYSWSAAQFGRGDDQFRLVPSVEVLSVNFETELESDEGVLHEGISRLGLRGGLGVEWMPRDECVVFVRGALSAPMDAGPELSSLEAGVILRAADLGGAFFDLALTGVLDRLQLGDGGSEGEIDLRWGPSLGIGLSIGI